MLYWSKLRSELEIVRFFNLSLRGYFYEKFYWHIICMITSLSKLVKAITIKCGAAAYY